VNDAAMRSSAGQPATPPQRRRTRKTAGKPARGGQALDLLTIALKTDAALSKAFFSKAGQKYSM